MITHTHTHLCVRASLHFFGLGVLVPVTSEAVLQRSPGFSPPGLGSFHSRERRQGGRAEQALPGAAIVLLHRAVLVALMAGTLHFVVTGGGEGGGEGGLQWRTGNETS